MNDTDLYDIEDALREVARARRRRDPLTAETARLADQLASRLAQHFGPEATETAGLALVLAAASLGVLAEVPTVVAANLVAFAGQRLVADSRAADGAVSGDG